jgi:hypothetical protein
MGSGESAEDGENGFDYEETRKAGEELMRFMSLPPAFLVSS